MLRRIFSIPMTVGILCYVFVARDLGSWTYFEAAFKKFSKLPHGDYDIPAHGQAVAASIHHGPQAGGFFGFVAAYLGAWVAIRFMQTWRFNPSWFSFSIGLIGGLLTGAVGAALGGYLDACCLHIF